MFIIVLSKLKLFNKYKIYFKEDCLIKEKIYFFQFKLFEQPLYVILLNIVIILSNLQSIIIGYEQKKIKIYFNIIDLSELPVVQV